VSRGWALRCVSGGVGPRSVPEAPPLQRFFSVPIVEVLLQEGSAAFFDLLKRKEFAALVASPISPVTPPR